MHLPVLRTSFLALLLLGSLDAGSTFADAPHTLAALPLSQSEQTARLSGLASQAIGRQLFPRSVESISPAPYFQRDYREQWKLESRGKRINLAEQIGEQGRARWAAERGLVKFLGSQSRGIPQGLDAVYWDPYRGRVISFESKGGTSPVKKYYGSWQGTNTNSISEAQRVLKSPKTTEIEKLQAARVIEAAKKGHLDSGVVRTPHAQGKPGLPVLEGSWNVENVSQEAIKAKKNLIKNNPSLRAVFVAAEKAHAWDRIKFRAGQGVAGIGIVGAVGLGWDAYQHSRDAWSMFHDPVLRGTALPYLQLGQAAVRSSEAATLGLGSAAHLGFLGKCGLKTFGLAAGRLFLPVAFTAEGLNAGMAYYEYSNGRISRRDFYRRTTGPAIFTVFTSGGAIVGGIIGAPAGGVGVAPGAAVGAGIGATVAIPIQYLADWTWNWYYREFDVQQRRAVDKTVERFYGFEE